MGRPASPYSAGQSLEKEIIKELTVPLRPQRMRERQGHGAELLDRKPVGQGPALGGRGAVLRVPEDGAAQVRHVDPELVGAARFWL